MTLAQVRNELREGKPAGADADERHAARRARERFKAGELGF